jgi:hypothetical protein
MLCQHDGSCQTLCEKHWGDCNDDYRDGCETPIEHKVYCAGDPRIAEEKVDHYNPPEVSLHREGEEVGPGHFDGSQFTYRLECYLHALESCYRRVLATHPKLEAITFYDFTLGSDGRLIAPKLVQTNVDSSELRACVVTFAEAVRFEEGPRDGFVTFPYRVVFTRGYYDSKME